VARPKPPGRPLEAVGNGGRRWMATAGNRPVRRSEVGTGSGLQVDSRLRALSRKREGAHPFWAALRSFFGSFATCTVEKSTRER
jgi:hypothetical protein